MEHVELLLTVLSFTVPSPEQSDAFLRAVQTSEVSEMEKYLQLPINPNEVMDSDLLHEHDEQDWHPVLWHASAGGNLEAVRILLEAGAEKEAVSSDCLESPLGTASRLGHVEIVEMLLQAGADRERSTEMGLSPLQAASSHGHLKVAQVLIQAKAQMNREDTNGSTPLLSACSGLHWELARLLIEARANVDQEDHFGDAPLRLACRYGTAETVEMLLTLRMKTVWTLWKRFPFLFLGNLLLLFLSTGSIGTS